MATFIVNTPIETSTPTIEVTVGGNNTLRLGRHRFQLVVVDDSGNESEPDVVEVRVADTERPTAVLTAPASVPFNGSFNLSGTDSSDVGGGQVVRYRWTYLGPAPTISPGPILVNPGVLQPTTTQPTVSPGTIATSPTITRPTAPG
jgi:hypothetical protein